MSDGSLDERWDASGSAGSDWAPAVEEWLLGLLEADPDAPVIPISALDGALKRLGRSVTDLAEGWPDLGELQHKGRRRLFTGSRLRALHKWLLKHRGKLGSEAEEANLETVLARLREDDPLGPAGEAHPVLRAVLRVSLDAVRSIGLVERAVARVGKVSSRGTDLSSRVGLWIPVRVPPVDLFSTLAGLAGESWEPPPKAGEDDGQLGLFNRARYASGVALLERDAREALADRFDGWLRETHVPAEVAELAQRIRDALRGPVERDEAVDALVRVSVAQLKERHTVAELARVDAVLGAEDAVSALAEYGDYLARGLRRDEAVRAYRRAKRSAEGDAVAALEERIAFQLEQQAKGRDRRRKAGEPISQLPLRF